MMLVLHLITSHSLYWNGEKISGIRLCLPDKSKQEIKHVHSSSGFSRHHIFYAWCGKRVQTNPPGMHLCVMWTENSTSLVFCLFMRQWRSHVWIHPVQIFITFNWLLLTKHIMIILTRYLYLLHHTSLSDTDRLKLKYNILKSCS